MNFREREVKTAYIKEAIISILIGTLSGLVVYQIFLYFKIAIFGWNLGLIFAPLIAGYVETLVANRLIGEGIGAISAFFLFAYTTFYSFILRNPSLGFNLITFGSAAVILQAAFPTTVNYIIIALVTGIGSYLSGIFKILTSFFNHEIDYAYIKYIRKNPDEFQIETVPPFDEKRSNEIINNLDFYFITSTDLDMRIINLGQFHATVIIEKDKRLIHSDQKTIEVTTLNTLKQAKDQCLIKLAKSVKSAGGNGIIDLEIDYGTMGLGGESYQITAMGMGVYLK